MMDTITRLCEFDSPTPIQAYVIPAVLQGKDVVACAQTGTFCFSLALPVMDIN